MYFRVDSGASQLVFDDHDDDAEHADDEGVVADPLALLEKGFPPTEPVADVRLVLAHGERGDAHADGRDIGARRLARRTSSAGRTGARRPRRVRDASGRLDAAEPGKTTAELRRLAPVLGVARVLRVDADQSRGGLFVGVIPAAAGRFHGRWYRQGGHRFP